MNLKITFTPLDIGTFLVSSRTRPNEHHLLDLIELGCSCEGFEFSDPYNTCFHIREAIRRRKRGKLRMIVAMRPRQSSYYLPDGRTQ